MDIALQLYSNDEIHKLCACFDRTQVTAKDKDFIYAIINILTIAMISRLALYFFTRTSTISVYPFALAKCTAVRPI